MNTLVPFRAYERDTQLDDESLVNTDTSGASKCFNDDNTVPKCSDCHDHEKSVCNGPNDLSELSLRRTSPVWTNAAVRRKATVLNATSVQLKKKTLHSTRIDHRIVRKRIECKLSTGRPFRKPSYDQISIRFMNKLRSTQRF